MENQLMKFQVADNRLKMEIKISDLIWLFDEHPDNYNNMGKDYFVRVKQGKTKEFTQWLIGQLQEESDEDSGILTWGTMFDQIFNRVLDGFIVEDEIFDYSDYMR